MLLGRIRRPAKHSGDLRDAIAHLRCRPGGFDVDDGEAEVGEGEIRREHARKVKGGAPRLVRGAAHGYTCEEFHKPSP